MTASDFPEGIYLVDFEFHPSKGKEGNPPVPVCMVVRRWPNGETSKYWQDELFKLSSSPFPVGEKALFVAFYASAELDCFHTLGWEFPVNVLDLFVEFRCITNGLKLTHGNSLLGVLLYFGLPNIGGEQKDEMRDLVLTRGPWSKFEKEAILEYCESDVVALSGLLNVMEKKIDWPRSLLRGRYMKAVSRIQMNGIPIDQEIYATLLSQWNQIQDLLIAEIDQDYGVYEGRAFKASSWEAYLISNKIPWPRLESGRLDLRDDTFRVMARMHQKVAPIRELRSSLSEMRLANLNIGDDSRNRCLLSPFRARTGRNQPSNSKYSALLFGCVA